MRFVQSVDIKYSAARKRDEHRFIAPPEMTKMTEQGNVYLNTMDEQVTLHKDKSVNFSTNASEEGTYYIEFS